MKKGGIRMEQLFYTSDDIAQMLGVSKSKAYAIIRSLNAELKEKGLLVGKGYSESYHKTMHSQLSCIFNHACRFYGLKMNPARKAGVMGKEEIKEMLFWTKEEYVKFAEAIMDKPQSYYAFEILYWCGIRCGQCLALTMEDFDFERGLLRINKSYQRLEKKDIITTPKTQKSNRFVQIPGFLMDEMKEYFKMLYGYKPTDRIFQITKSFLHHEMDRGSKAAGVKRIRVHDLRHSHVSLSKGYFWDSLADCLR